MHSDAAMDGAVEELEPQRHQSDVEPPPLASPPLAQWSTQADFLLHCSELAAGGIPASHPSQLAPLLAHPPSETIDYAVFYKEMEAAMAGTQAIKSGVAAAEPISCLRDPPHAALPPNGSKARIGARAAPKLCFFKVALLHHFAQQQRMPAVQLPCSPCRLLLQVSLSRTAQHQASKTRTTCMHDH